MPTGRTRLPAWQRASEPPSINLMQRDRAILIGIHTHDGMLTDEQISRLYFNGDLYSAKRRMRILFQNGYVARFSRKERYAHDSMCYWLDSKGAQFVASLEGISFKEFKWVRPREKYAQIPHDTKVNNIRITVELAAWQFDPDTKLVLWESEHSFRSAPDNVKFLDAKGTERSRIVYPDGFFAIRRPSTKSPGKRVQLNFLVECDMKTHSTTAFAEEKVRSWAAYIRSPQYATRFGSSGGRALIVTTSHLRLSYLKRRIERLKLADMGFFFLTTFDDITPENFFTQPIWYRAGNVRPMSIFGTE